MNTNDLNIKKDFPLLTANPKLAFLDNAATTQKPSSVIDAEAAVYRTNYANIHRAVYDLAASATAAFEGARARAAQFMGAAASHEIIFTPNASTALNLAAYIEGQKLQSGDEMLVAVAGHHSNILPWMRLQKTTGAKVVWLETGSDYRVDKADFTKKLSRRTKLVALAHVSNVLGDVVPVAELAALAHQAGARVVVDGAQSSCRIPINVKELGADYMAFSAHKMYGPTGVGWLWGKEELLAAGEPLVSGGGTIANVTRQTITWADVPWRYEAGTPDIAGVIALNTLFDYLETVGMDAVWQHDQAVTAYMLPRLLELPGITMYGSTENKERAALISFTYSVSGKVVHPHDVAEICNQHQVAIRGGHHCAQPLMESLGVETLNRVSAGMYTTPQDIDRLVAALQAVDTIFKKS